MDPEVWRNIPQELLPPVLARLPWWSNLQLRGVCRSWNQKLSDPEYFSRCKSLPTAPPQALCCILSSGILSTAGSCALVNIVSKTWNALPRPSSLPNFEASDFFEVGAATAGLLLMEGKLVEKDRVLINPLNKTHRRLPPVPTLAGCCSKGYIARGVIKEQTHGMVVDDFTQNVRVVALQHQMIDGHVIPTGHSQILSDLEFWKIYVFDMNRNSWDLVSSIQSEHLQRIKNVTLVGEDLYILTKQPSSRHRHRHRVFKTLASELVEVPADITIDIPTVHLFTHRGSLMLVTGVLQKQPSVDVWRLDQVAEKWHKVSTMPENLVNSGWGRKDFQIDVEGDFTCFTSYAKKEVILILNLMEKVWESVDCRHHVFQDWASIRTFLWQPRLDIVLS